MPFVDLRFSCQKISLHSHESRDNDIYSSTAARQALCAMKTPCSYGILLLPRGDSVKLGACHTYRSIQTHDTPPSVDWQHNTANPN